MKKLCKFVLGCIGLICEGVFSIVPFIASILLISHISIWFAFTLIITLPLSLYLAMVIWDLSCTNKFIEWTFGMEVGE